MAKRVKVELNSTISEALGALGDIQSLKEEMEEWRDNLDGANMTHLPKYDEVSECCDELDSVPDDIDVPEFLQQVSFSYIQSKPGKSRAARRDDAVSMLDMARTAAEDFDIEEAVAAFEDLSEEQREEKKQDMESERDEFVNAVKEAIDAADGANFPGMY